MVLGLVLEGVSATMISVNLGIRARLLVATLLHATVLVLSCLLKSRRVAAEEYLSEGSVHNIAPLVFEHAARSRYTKVEIKATQCTERGTSRRNVRITSRPSRN